MHLSSAFIAVCTLDIKHLESKLTNPKKSLHLQSAKGGVWIMQHLSIFLAATQQDSHCCSTCISIYLHPRFFIKEQKDKRMNIKQGTCKPTTTARISLALSHV
jgi:hypothetical protein